MVGRLFGCFVTLFGGRGGGCKFVHVLVFFCCCFVLIFVVVVVVVWGRGVGGGVDLVVSIDADDMFVSS